MIITGTQLIVTYIYTNSVAYLLILITTSNRDGFQQHNEQFNDDFGYDAEYMSVSLCFWLLVPFSMPSILCSLFLLIHLLGTRTLRQPINNHSIIVVLILGLIYVSINVSSTTTFYRLNCLVWPQSPTFCSIWLFVDYGVYNAITVLLAWASFERHILVFHQQLVNTHLKKIIFHYIPLYFLLIYMSAFYIIVMFFYPCTNDWNYTSDVCGDYGCYHDNDFLSYWELYLHGTVPVILIAFFNITLLLRVICHKRTVHQPIVWKKYRKMAIQLLSISALYLLVNFPLFFLAMMHLVGLMLNEPASEILMYFTDHVIMFLPFVCLGCLPELWKKLKNIFYVKHWIMTRIGTTQVTPLPIQPRNNF
ncbi:hypothetical protein I4U23_004526 [Adineta vaga]|nr:hypothetical protein I4U23_004526 [Adineta vaga]